MPVDVEGDHWCGEFSLEGGEEWEYLDVAIESDFGIADELDEWGAEGWSTVAADYVDGTIARVLLQRRVR